jgi:hypothetical protein
MAYTDGPGAGRTPTVRFEVIGDAWQKLSANMAPWVLAALVVGILVGAIMGAYYVPVFAASFAAAAAGGGKDTPPGLDIGGQFIGMVVGTAVQIMQFVFLGGMVKMALNQLRGQPISVGDVFSGFAHFGPLALAGLLYSLGTQLGVLFCIIPGLLLAGLWMLTIPLIVDQNLDAITALTTSLKTLQPQMWMALLLYLVLSIVAGIGWVVCGIGMVVTYPLLPLGLTLVYRDFFPERFQPQEEL